AKPSALKISLKNWYHKLHRIDLNFLRQVTNFIELITFINPELESKGFIFYHGMKKQTYAYGEKVCEWLSLKHRENYPQKIEILSGKSIRKVAYGSNMVVILTENDGQIYLAGGSSLWPKSSNDEMRLLSKTKHFRDIACGGLHMLCLEENGHLYTIGCNDYGQCTSTKDYDFENLIDTELTNIRTIACGWMHSLAITDDNRLLGWGMNFSKQIANDNSKKITKPFLMMAEGQYDDKYESITAGHEFTLAITTRKLVRCFQNNRDNFERRIILTFKNEYDFKAIEVLSLASTGLISFFYENHDDCTNIVIFDQYSSSSSKTIEANNFQEMLDKFFIKPITFGWSMNTSEVDLNLYHYQMSESIEATFDLPDSDVNDLRFEFLNVNDDNTKKRSRYIYVQRSYLRMVSEYFNRMFSNEWNDQKTFFQFELKSGGFIFYLGMKNQTYAYGETVCEWLSLKHQKNYPQKIEILSGKSIRKVAYGANMVVILTENDGQIYLGGGGMRLLSKTKHFKDIACGYSHILCLEENGHLYTIGLNDYGQCGNGTTINDYENLIDTELTNIRTIACGWLHSLAVTDDNRLFGWGWNFSNQITNSDDEMITKPFLMMAEGQYNDKYENISAGERFTLAITTKKEIRQFKNFNFNSDSDSIYIPSFYKYNFEATEILTLASTNLICILYENHRFNDTKFLIFDPFSLLFSPKEAFMESNFQDLFEKFLSKPITFGWCMNTDEFDWNLYHYFMSESINATFDCPDSEVNDLRFEFPNDDFDDTKK
uniref:Uncharacterized protein LOC113797008 n=1 Tax=Dermatophagoides pteronyssinus TaxID=6956 RepID=A0A6P6YCP7_DERPT